MLDLGGIAEVQLEKAPEMDHAVGIDHGESEAEVVVLPVNAGPLSPDGNVPLGQLDVDGCELSRRDLLGLSRIDERSLQGDVDESEGHGDVADPEGAAGLEVCSFESPLFRHGVPGLSPPPTPGVNAHQDENRRGW